MKKGKIILLNGSSSAGKTTIATMLQQLSVEPYQHIALDQFRDGMPPQYRGFNSPKGTTGASGLNIVPENLNEQLVTSIQFGEFGKQVLKGMRRSVVAFADLGINVIVDDLMIEREFFEDYATLFKQYEFLCVAVRCPLKEVEQRENLRPGRFPGTATWLFERVHENMIYDLQVDTSINSPRDCAERILKAFANKKGTEIIS